MVRVLMVCLGNICRSPMAEAVFRAHVERAGLGETIAVASAGTGTWHLGEPPHPGTRAVLARHGLALPGKRAQHVSEFDLASFAYVLAMDAANLRDLTADSALGVELPRLLLDFAPHLVVRDVPDPYFDGGFDEVFALVDAGAKGLLEAISARRAPG